MRRAPTFRVRAFTLMEMMVVVGVIAILVAMSVPALGPILASNHQSEVLNTLNGVLTAAQTAAQANGTEVALRVERAYKTDKYGEMVDANGRHPHESGFQGPFWLPYQQIRYVILGTTTAVTGGAAFRRLPDSKVTKLPEGAWIAPDYATNSLYLNTNAPEYFDPNYLVNDYRPRDDGYPDVVNYNATESFYVVFSPAGSVTQFGTDRLVYRDESQRDADGTPLYVPYPHTTNRRFASARGFIVYDRKRYESVNPSGRVRRDFLAAEGRPVFISRFLGSIVEGESR